MVDSPTLGTLGGDMGVKYAYRLGILSFGFFVFVPASVTNRSNKLGLSSAKLRKSYADLICDRCLSSA